MAFFPLDPVARSFAAARPDDEDVTEKDRRSIREGEAWFAKRGGNGISMEAAMTEFGAKPEDISPNQ
jgi:hypothetical protein